MGKAKETQVSTEEWLNARERDSRSAARFPYWIRWTTKGNSNRASRRDDDAGILATSLVVRERSTRREQLAARWTMSPAVVTLKFDRDLIQQLMLKTIDMLNLVTPEISTWYTTNNILLPESKENTFSVLQTLLLIYSRCIPSSHVSNLYMIYNCIFFPFERQLPAQIRQARWNHRDKKYSIPFWIDCP